MVKSKVDKMASPGEMEMKKVGAKAWTCEMPMFRRERQHGVV